MTDFEKPLDWLEELAKAEIAMEETGKMDAFGHLDEEKILTHYTFAFLNQIRTLCQNHSSHFNQFRNDSRQTIKVYGIANTTADFLVFRNGLKLVVTYAKPGQIEISFHTLSGGLYTPLKKKSPSPQNRLPSRPGADGQLGDLIDIELGPFNEAYWTYQGIRITAQALVRFYLTEFVKNSGC